jgi:membrane-associated phospholipid phosphatase
VSAAAAVARRQSLIDEVVAIDRALYAAVAQTPTPLLDAALPRLARAADFSRLSLASAAMLAWRGGARGRKAAGTGLASVAVSSATVNLVAKRLGRRHRPDRALAEVPTARHVAMPRSASFPSGHTASAVAFASGVASIMPAVGVPLHTLAAVVAYSRVHTGVHYPGDVVAGAVVGSISADLTAGVLARRPRAPHSPASRS